MDLKKLSGELVGRQLLAHLLRQALDEADRQGMGLVAVKISEALDHLENETTQ